MTEQEHAPRWSASPKARLVACTLVVAGCYLAQGLFYARTLLPSGDMVQYLVAGRLAVRGEISLFDDRLHGNRPPLPFYVLGLTQLWGPSLLAARGANIVWGLATLLLTALLARRLGGAGAGVLAASFLATQGVVVAYYSNEGYAAFSAFAFTAGVLLLLSAETPRRRLVGMAAVGLLFFVRTNLWPTIPLLLAWALRRAATPAERLGLLAVVGAPPLVFFGSDARHLKLLAYVPLLDRFVAPLGYRSAFVLDDRTPLTLAENLWEAARLVRRYEFWVLALALLAGVEVARRIRRREPVLLGDGRIRLLGGLFVFMLAAQLVIFRLNWKWVGVYFPAFAPLVPLLLGTGYSRLLAGTEARSGARRLRILMLAALLVPPLYFVRHPLLPVGEARLGDPLGRVQAAAARLREAVPPDAKVFLYAWNVGYYLSGLPPTYLQQAYSDWHLAGIEADEFTLRRSGFVPLGDLRRWLSREAGYAVIDPAYLAAHEEKFPRAIRLIRDRLARDFEKTATIADYPAVVYDVYRRRADPRIR